MQGELIAGFIAPGSEQGEAFLHQRGAIGGHDTEGVACFIGQAGVAEIDFKMPDLLAGPFGIQQAVGEEFGPIGFLFRPERHGRFCLGFIGGSSGRGSGQGGEHRFHPRGGGLVVVHIAVGARVQPGRPEGFKAGVKVLARLTKFGVIGIPEGQHREAGVLEGRSGVGGQDIPEGLGVVRHLAIPVGAGDDQHIGLPGEIHRGMFGHVDDPGVDGAFFGGGGDFFGEAGG